MQASVPDCPLGDEASLGKVSWAIHVDARRRAALWAALAVGTLLVLYTMVLALSTSLEHAGEQIIDLWGWLVPVFIGFGVQVGLFAYARRVTREAARVGSGAVVVSGGASTLSMIACCAHHLADLLPVLGLSGAAVFLTRFQGQFLLLAILSNVLGLVHILGLMRKHRLFPARDSLLTQVLRVPFERLLPLSIIGAFVLFGVSLIFSTL